MDLHEFDVALQVISTPGEVVNRWIVQCFGCHDVETSIIAPSEAFRAKGWRKLILSKKEKSSGNPMVGGYSWIVYDRKWICPKCLGEYRKKQVRIPKKPKQNDRSRSGAT